MFDNQKSLHDPTEIKRLFLEGSKQGKNIIKKEDQLKEVKLLLDKVDQKNTKELKNTLKEMYNIYEHGRALETKVSNLNREYTKDVLLGFCYNYVAQKMETLDTLKQKFESEIQGY